MPSAPGATGWTPPAAGPYQGERRVTPHSRWTAGPVVAHTGGALLTLASTGPLLGGGALLLADRTQRDGGWLTSPRVEVSTAQYAVVSKDITLRTTGADWVVDDLLGRVRLQAAAQNPADAIFVGVAPSSAVADYLRGVGRTRLDRIGTQQDGGKWTGDAGSGTGYRMDPGTMSQLPDGPPATAPGDLDIWTASSAGTGTQTLEWRPRDGHWAVVVMPVDRTAGLSVGLAVGATAPGLSWVAGGLLVAGVVLLAVGVLLIALAVHWAQARPTPPAPGGPAAPPSAPGPAPAGTQPTTTGDPTLAPSGGPR